MRIAFVLERLGNGGAERVTSALANSLVTKENIEVHVFTYVKESGEYSLASQVIRHNMAVGDVSGIAGLVRKSKYLYSQIRKIAPDYVISLATPKTSILLSFISMGANYKLILSERNDPNQYPKEKIYKVLRNFAYSSCDGVVFQTPDAQSYFSRKIQNKSVVIPNPVSNGLPERYIGLRRKSIVNFCRLESQKNIELLISSFADINLSFPDYNLELFGDGPQRQELEALSEKLGIRSKVIFHGFTADIHEKIVSASIYVSSSNYEGISNSMIEALALGIPTISTDCPIGGARMMIKDKENGLLVPVGDQKALTQAIKFVLSDEILMEKFSQNGYLLRKKISADYISQVWLDFIVQRGGKHVS